MIINGQAETKLILIVEDDEVMLKSLAAELTDGGFKVEKAEDGEVGLRLALKEHPDLILLDIRLPKIDGVTVMEHLRKDSWGATAKVIVLSAVDPDHAMLEAVNRYTPAYYLVKSRVKLGEVTAKVKEVLEKTP